jgi:hypothetical protein
MQISSPLLSSWVTFSSPYGARRRRTYTSRNLLTFFLDKLQLSPLSIYLSAFPTRIRKVAQARHDDDEGLR